VDTHQTQTPTAAAAAASSTERRHERCGSIPSFAGASKIETQRISKSSKDVRRDPENCASHFKKIAQMTKRRIRWSRTKRQLWWLNLQKSELLLELWFPVRQVRGSFKDPFCRESFLPKAQSFTMGTEVAAAWRYVTSVRYKII
jgi:hypothetical protein